MPSPPALGEFDDFLVLAADLVGADYGLLRFQGVTHGWFRHPPDTREVGGESAWVETRLAGDSVSVVSEGLPSGLKQAVGAGLFTTAGERLGGWCVFAREPAALSPAQRETLERLGRRMAAQAQAHARELARFSAALGESPTGASPRRHEYLVNHGASGWLLLDALGGTLFASDSLYSEMGYRPEEILGESIFKLVHPEDVEPVLKAFADVLLQPRNRGRVELRCRHRDGSWKWKEVAAENLLEDPAFRAVACNLWDISSRKAMELALRQSEASFRRVTDSNMVGIFFWNLDGSISSANDRFLEMIGYTRQEMLDGRVNWMRLTPEEYRQADLAATQEILSTGFCRPFEKEYVRKDGSRIPVLLGAATLEGSREMGSCFVIDLTRQKQAQQQVERLAAFPKHNPNPVFEFNQAGDLTYCNAAAEALTATLGRKYPFEILPSGLNEIVAGCLRSERPFLRHEEKINQRTVSWSFFPVPAVGIVHCYAMDMTERLALEAQLRQSQKMECVGQLAGGVAHDFNNILTVIQGHANLLAEETLSPSLYHSARQIAESAERAANLTRQLLTFSRRQVLQPRNLDLNGVVCALAKILQRVLGEDVLLNVRYASNLPPVHADPGMIEQVLMNLAVNSREAMPRGGHLEIRLKTALVTEALTRTMPEARTGSFIQLTVKDTGCGISKENLERIFEPFFTTKEMGHGTGLGLATVYGIVKQHHGWIHVESAPGHGTQFDIFFPASDRGAPVSTVAEPKPVRRGCECILLVEDEEPLRELVRCVLESYGYKVIEAASGRLALDVWKQHSDKIDLLLTDIVMPDGVTGRDLADALVQERPGLRVLFTSGYSADIVGKDFILSDGVNFLQKPYNPQTLAETVRDCLDR